MEDEKTETEKSVHSQVRVLCQGGQTGFKPRTEPPPQGPGGRGVEGLMGYVPQVVTRKGGMPAPRTRLQHLVDSKILSGKELTERYHASHELGGWAQAVPSQRARKRVISSSGARGRPWSSKSPSCYAPAVTNNRSHRGRCGAVRSR